MAKIGIITDVHNSDRSDLEPEARPWKLEQRWYTNAPTRMTNFAATMEARGDIDFCIDLGDIVDDQITSGQELTELTEITDALEADWTGDMHYVIGNHEIAIWYADFTDYESEITQTPPDGGNFWTTGKPAGYPDTTAYSFDNNGIHFVVMIGHAWDDPPTVEAAVLTWLDADLAATSLPIVVFCHTYLSTIMGNGIAEYNDAADVQATLENYNVQAVIQGHMHAVPRKNDFLWVKNEIPYYHLRGNCSGPMDGSTPDTDVGKDPAFYVFDIRPDAAQGRDRVKANISVVCYFTPTDDLNIYGMDKNFDTYLPIGV